MNNRFRRDALDSPPDFRLARRFRFFALFDSC